MKQLFACIAGSPQLAEIRRLLAAEGGQATVTGLTETLGCFVAAALLGSENAPLLLVTSGPKQAESALDDLVSIIGSDRVGFLPPQHQHPYETTPLAAGPRNERTEALLRIGSGAPGVIVTQPEALLETWPQRDWICANTRRLGIGELCDRDELLAALVNADYRREALVDSQGQFAVRGGLVDIFPLGSEHPVRLEFDGDVISTLRRFDPTTQRSVLPVESISILLGEDGGSGGSRLLDLLPDSALTVWLDMGAIRQRLDNFLERAGKIRKVGGGVLNPDNQTKVVGVVPNPDSQAADNSDSRAWDKPDYLELPARLRSVIWSGALTRGGGQVDFAARPADPFPVGAVDLATYLRRYQSRSHKIWITADTTGEKERLEEQLAESGVEGIAITIPSVAAGFSSSVLNLAVLTTHELYDRRRMRARHTRFRRRAPAAVFDRASLVKGDLVVHTDFGIGSYEGLQMVKVRGQPTESLRIRYADNVILFVRVDQFGLVEKYSGSDAAKPQLSRIGSADWARAKQRTKKALADMTAEIVRLYAQRKVVTGRAFPPDTHWQQEMEASFEFEDTPDQIVATADVKRDLESSNPMDRLLCGDVGFGKTEIAVRAAFKVVQDSHQVAILVPTTILAQQHYETFRNRIASYPVRIEVLSRFRTPAEQKQVVRGLADGSVDIVIGTHRLLSKDIAFKQLGLLVIDEEHRFGVRHKERLKQLKTDVDVLTLTATPIPRTLQLALSGARDTSQINTPPVDRLPVQTEVHAWSEELIRDAILSEVDRQGQVFFVHNRVQSIHAVRGMLGRLAPGLRYAVAHGQMPERELEKVMVDFMQQRYDVLVSTMIIEAGLDIPNVNTLVVNRADRFGLAQLYQLRGRIGRSNRQAYAYLLTPPRLAMTDEARRRLGTLMELSELGSGLKVAMRDLEIRGAGNLLGAEQSGFINAVGFDLYTRLLDEAVHEMKGEAAAITTQLPDVKVDYDGPAFLPVEYIDEGDLRYDFYRRFANAARADLVDHLAGELSDRFGPPPEPARNLMEVVRLKLLAGAVGFTRLEMNDDYTLAELNLPPDPERSQRYIGRLVAAAAPEEVEFRMRDKVELVYRFNTGHPLQRTRYLLEKLKRSDILKD
jgi:transcription-repair coupling factor (superfamily II helicase)